MLEIVKIDGTVNGGPHVFRKDVDYRLNTYMVERIQDGQKPDEKKDVDYTQSAYVVEWIQDGQKPDENTPFFVNYRLDAPQGITDINPGSVIRNIVESMALEIDFLYAQMNQVYNSGFIDTATDKSLDLIVSMLGINRKLAESATGEVTFGRNNDPGEIEIEREAHAFDGRERYELNNFSVKSIKNLEGISGNSQIFFVKGQDFEVSGGEIGWLEGGKKPDAGSVFYVDYTAYEEFTIPEDTRVSNYSRRPENLKIFRTSHEAILKRNSSGKWEVEVPVEALTKGKEGNIFAGNITVMPKPVMGIEYVINKKDILNGTDVESDSNLRERAKLALEKAGKATFSSLKSAVQGIKGISGEVKIVDLANQPDGIPGIVQIVAIGGDEKEIKQVIDLTRSAGIMVEFLRPTIVPIDIKLTILVEGKDVDKIRKEVYNVVHKYIDTMEIDDDVILNHIIKSVLNIKGIMDVRDITINGVKENKKTEPNEKSEIRTLEIFVEE